jgi:hypothetical protein
LAINGDLGRSYDWLGENFVVGIDFEHGRYRSTVIHGIAFRAAAAAAATAAAAAAAITTIA